jgi:hypothetical protein
MNISINNEEILVFDFDFDQEYLLSVWQEYKNQSIPYSDKRFNRFVMNNWRIVNNLNLDYADYLAQHFDINASPKFYILDANTSLVMHVDQDTTCAINFVLSDNPAPVRFKSGNSYFYKTALLNTSVKHAVDKTDSDRILFKLSIKDEPFGSVKQKIINTLSRSNHGR